MSTEESPLIVIVSALGAQGAGVVSTFLASQQFSHYRIRALTSNPSSEAAVGLAANNPRVTVTGVDLSSLDSVVAAFQDATFIFAQTVFRPEVFASQGAGAAQALEEKHGLNIAQAASKIPTLQHLIWSSLPDALTISQGKYDIGHIQSKISTEKYLQDAQNRLAEKTTYLYVGLYGSNLGRWPYCPVYVKGAQKYVISLPCSPHVLIPFIGDESANVGVIAQAIFAQPEKTIGKYVLGASETISCTDWASVLSRVIKQDVAFAEITLESFEAVWGAAGNEIGLMFKYFSDFEKVVFTPISSSILSPAELGVQASLRSTEQRLQDMDWSDIIS